MISKISNRIVNYLIEQKDLSTNEQELYSYGLFILLSQLLYFIITVFIGIILGVILESIIYYIAFQFIRRYAGGYHASTETRCEIMSTLSIVACIVVIKLSKTYDFQTMLFIITMVSAVLIFFLCPLDTPEKPLTEKEFKYFRKISWLILIAITVVVIISYCFKFRFVLVPCCMSLILESILLVAGKVKRVSQENSAK
jgi:accessory gene regulator B